MDVRGRGRELIKLLQHSCNFRFVVVVFKTHFQGNTIKYMSLIGIISFFLSFFTVLGISKRGKDRERNIKEGKILVA